jgi:hypothetical protein
LRSRNPGTALKTKRFPRITRRMAPLYPGY